MPDIWTLLFLAGLLGVPMVYVGLSLAQSLQRWRRSRNLSPQYRPLRFGKNLTGRR